MEPVRKVVTRTGRSMRGKFPSLKMGRSIGCESRLEADAALLFEWTPEILRYHAQPCHEYPTDGINTFRYTPDFLLEMVGGAKIYVEIKPAKKLGNPTLRQRLTNIENHFRRSDRSFQIFTEITLHNGVINHNVRKLQYHARRLPESIEFWETYQRLIRREYLTFGAVQQAFADPRHPYQLLSNRWLAFDIELPLVPNTPLVVPGPEVRHVAFHI